MLSEAYVRTFALIRLRDTSSSFHCVLWACCIAQTACLIILNLIPEGQLTSPYLSLAPTPSGKEKHLPSDFSSHFLIEGGKWNKSACCHQQPPGWRMYGDSLPHPATFQASKKTKNSGFPKQSTPPFILCPSPKLLNGGFLLNLLSPSLFISLVCSPTVSQLRHSWSPETPLWVRVPIGPTGILVCPPPLYTHMPMTKLSGDMSNERNQEDKAVIWVPYSAPTQCWPCPLLRLTLPSQEAIPWQRLSFPTVTRRPLGGSFRTRCLSHSLVMTIPGNWDPRAIRTAVHISSSSPSGFWKEKGQLFQS